MTTIYSNKPTDLFGVYIDPRYFKQYGVDNNATLVYTDDKEIADAYTKIGVEVLPITKVSETKQAKQKTVK